MCPSWKNWPTGLLVESSALGSTSRPSGPRLSWRWLIPLTGIGLIASAMLCSCSRQPVLAIPLQTIPHQLSQPATLSIWVGVDPTHKVEQQVQVPAGWWLASPTVVEGRP